MKNLLSKSSNSIEAIIKGQRNYLESVKVQDFKKNHKTFCQPNYSFKMIKILSLLTNLFINIVKRVKDKIHFLKRTNPLNTTKKKMLQISLILAERRIQRKRIVIRVFDQFDKRKMRVSKNHSSSKS